MKLTLNGHEYQSQLLPLLNPSIGEARIIKRNTGMTIAEWRLGLMTMQREDPDVLAGLVFLLRQRAGEVVDWAELEELSSQELNEAITMEDSDADPPEETVEEAPVEEAPVEEAPVEEAPVEEPAPVVKPVSTKPRKTPAKRTTKPKPAAS